jgi:hypothetical protein
MLIARGTNRADCCAERANWISFRRRVVACGRRHNSEPFHHVLEGDIPILRVTGQRPASVPRFRERLSRATQAFG